MLPRTFKKRRQAFTLVELLVVIAIIGILVALLLPAVQAAREAARRSQCSNNFRQVGIATQGYHAAERHFPAGLYMWGDAARGRSSCGAPPGRSDRYFGPGWGYYILPYLEESALHSRFDFTTRKTGAAYAEGPNFAAGGEFIPAYLCPSDPQGRELVFCCSTISNGGGVKEDLARTNMAGVADSLDWSCEGTWPRRDANGVLFQSSDVATKDITDGSSHTLIVGEIIGSGEGTNDGYFWVTWDVLHTNNGINLPLRIPPRGSWVVEDTGFASHHPGGCYFALADGSVQFIQESIEQSLLAGMATRAGGETGL